MATIEELVNGLIDIACLNDTKFPTPEMCFGMVLWDDPPTDQLVREVGMLQASMIIAGYLMVFIQKKITTGEWDCDQEAAYDKFISEELAYLRQAQWHYEEETQSLYEEVAQLFRGLNGRVCRMLFKNERLLTTRIPMILTTLWIASRIRSISMNMTNRVSFNSKFKHSMRLPGYVMATPCV